MARSTRATARPHLGGHVRRSVLPSGLRVVTEEMAGSHTLALGIFVDVGSRHEGHGLVGAAHFLEHILFKGTPTRTAEEISAAFDSVGGEVNAYTAKEHTCFYAKVLADDGQMAVDVLVDMLTHSLVAPGDLEQERTVILDEIAMHEDDPMEVAYSLAAAALYQGSALDREVIGTRASVGALTRAQVHSFWRRHYRPCDLVVSAAGHVDHDALVASLTGVRGSGSPRRHRVADLDPVRPALATLRRPTEQANCILGFRGLRQFDERRYPAELLTLVLGGGMSSRLFVEVRERRGLAYHIDAGCSSYSDAGQFVVEWMSSPDRVVDILGLVGSVLKDVIAKGVRPEELQRAKGQMRGQTLLAYESPDARMMRLGRSELAGDDRTMDFILDRFEAVTVDEVRAVARDLVVAPPTLAVVGPPVPRRRLERAVVGWADTLDHARTVGATP